MEYSREKDYIENELNDHFNNQSSIKYEYNDLVLRTRSISELCFKFCCFPCIYYYYDEKNNKLKTTKKTIDLCKTVDLCKTKEYQINYINKMIVDREKMIENQKCQIVILKEKLEIDYK